MFAHTGTLPPPASSPVHFWENGSCVLIQNLGAGGGAFLTAGHTGGTATENINRLATDGRAQYNVTSRHVHPLGMAWDFAILKVDADLSALPAAPTLASTPADQTGSVTLHMGGTGVTATGLGGSQVGPRAERWAIGTSVEPNYGDDRNPANVAVEYTSAANSGMVLPGDSGGGTFSADHATLYGINAGPNASSAQIAVGFRSIAGAIVMVRHWIATILDDATKPFISGRLEYDLVNMKIRVPFSELCDYIATGTAGKIQFTVGGIHYRTTNASPLAGGTNALFVELAIETTGSRTTGGSTERCWDIAAGTFENAANTKGNVASTDTLAFPMAYVADDQTPDAPVARKIKINLSHDSGGTAQTNGTSAVRIVSDQELAEAGAVVQSAVYDPFGYQLDLSVGPTGLETTDLSNDTLVIDAPILSTQTGTPGSSLLLEDTIRDATDTQGNDESQDVPVEYTAGTSLTFTNGVLTVATGTLAANTLSYRQFVAPDSSALLLSNDPAASIVTNGNLRLYVVDAAAIAEKKQTTDATPTLQTDVIAGRTYLIARGNTHSSGRSMGVLTVSLPVSTPTVSAASALPGAMNTSGLVLDRNGKDGITVSHFKVTGIAGGKVYEHDGVTEITEGAFITYAKGAEGLKAKAGVSFDVQACRGAADTQISAGKASVTVTLGDEGPSAVMRRRRRD